VSVLKQNVSNVALCGVLALGLVACGETPKLLGKGLPDETVVVDGPSLELPPEFSLRPPREGQDYESVLRAQKSAEAQALITGVSGTTSVEGTATVPAAESWLLDKTTEQTGAVQPGIREQLKTDAADKPDAAAETQNKRKQGLFGRWFGTGTDE
jgi:hypothetical protein